MTDSFMYNPHLEGGPFLWEGGPDGVLLVHGFTATTAEIRPLARELYAAGYTVAGPLLPGHFTRPEEINRYRWRDWARTVEEAYRGLAGRCRRVIVGGTSTGALLALNLAAGHPEVAAVLAYAVVVKMQWSWRMTAALYLAAPFVTAIPKRRPNDNPLWQGYDVYPLRGAIELRRLSKTVAGQLRRISQPLLVVQGRRDNWAHPTSAQFVYDGVRSTIKELHWMENSGHGVLIDAQRERVAALTVAFVRRVLADGE